MICTYCGRGHTAASCSVRPRRRFTIGLICIATLCVSACTQTVPTVPPSKLAAPPADLMAAPDALDPIPACEGERRCRARYYAASRAAHVTTAQRLRGLQRWVRVSRGETP